MTRDRIDMELNTWLDRSVQPLPDDVRTFTRDELLNHYLDSVKDYSAKGLSRMDAHERALRDLGTADVVAEGLQDAHRGQRLYIAGMLASMGNLMALIGLPLMYLNFNLGKQIGFIKFSILTDLILLLYTLTALFALRQLVSWRFGRRDLANAFRLVMGGLILQIAADITGLRLFGYSHNIDLHHAQSIVESTSALQAGVSAASALGFLAVGVGLVWIASRLYKTPQALYGLAPLVIGLFVLLGTLIGTSFIWINIPRSEATAIAGLIVIFVHLIIWPTLTLLFFRAAYRPFMLPRRLA